jgi:hypothetical protein
MSELSERHEVRVHGAENTIVFIADSKDGKLVIQQEADGRQSERVCAITLSDPQELRDFFQGLRRILASLGHDLAAPPATGATPPPQARPDRRRS